MVATRTRPSKSTTVPVRPITCGIYTRVSSDERLSQEFNSLHNQRESAENFIESQKHEGWIALADRYDDAGFSGGTLDRPGLRRLLEDVEHGRVNCIVVYKVDRLSRSLFDFAKIVEILEQHDASFVSITQQFNSTTSMGRLTLNVLLSFAQFEREVTRERILDKICGAKKRGKHCGGVAVLGFDIDKVMKRLVINEPEAKTVRHIFQRFVEIGSTTKLADELNRDGYKTKAYATVTGKVLGGKPWTKPNLYALINNPKYIGKVEHKGKLYDGEHEAIVSQKLWDEAHAILARQHQARGSTKHETPALLRGLIRCAHCDCAMGPTFSTRHGRRYLYYLCTRAGKQGYAKCPVRSVAAGSIESAVIGQLRIVLKSPEIVARTFREVRLLEAEEADRLRAEGNEHDARLLEAHAITENEVIEALQRFDGVWNELFPSEQQRIVQLLIERVDVSPDGLELRIHGEGLRSLIAELTAPKEAARCQ